MLTAIVVFIAVYGYQLFSWSDVMPLTLSDVAYMIEFTISHIMFSMGIIFEDGSIRLFDAISMCLFTYCM